MKETEINNIVRVIVNTACFFESKRCVEENSTNLFKKISHKYGTSIWQALLFPKKYTKAFKEYYQLALMLHNKHNI
jgi:hypothetical protein